MTIDRAAATRLVATDPLPAKPRTLSTAAMTKPIWRGRLDTALLLSSFTVLAVVLLGLWLSMMEANFWN